METCALQYWPAQRVFQSTIDVIISSVAPQQTLSTRSSSYHSVRSRSSVLEAEGDLWSAQPPLETKSTTHSQTLLKYLEEYALPAQKRKYHLYSPPQIDLRTICIPTNLGKGGTRLLPIYKYTTLQTRNLTYHGSKTKLQVPCANWFSLSVTRD